MRTIPLDARVAMSNTPEYWHIVETAFVHHFAARIWENFGPFSTREDVIAHVRLLTDDAASASAAEMCNPDLRQALRDRDARQLVAHFLECRLLSGNLSGIVGGTP